MLQKVKSWVCRRHGCNPLPKNLNDVHSDYWECARCQRKVDITHPNWSTEIESIMACFDFNKVHKTMALLDWRWENGEVCGQDYRIPTLLEVKAEARKLLEQITEPGNTAIAISCGGFEVTKCAGRLRLVFIVDEWETRK